MKLQVRDSLPSRQNRQPRAPRCAGWSARCGIGRARLSGRTLGVHTCTAPAETGNGRRSHPGHYLAM